MHERQHPKRIEDYTNAALVMAFLNLFAALLVIWGLFGYGAALLVAFALHLIIRWRQQRPTR